MCISLSLFRLAADFDLLAIYPSQQTLVLVLPCLVIVAALLLSLVRLVAFLFGLRAAQLPLPAEDWSGFVFVLGLLNQKEELPPTPALPLSLSQNHAQAQGPPLKWLNMQALTITYGPAPGQSVSWTSN